MTNTRDISFTDTRAIMVGISTGHPGVDADDESLDELSELLSTCGVVAAGRVLQNRDTPDSKYLIGEGKVGEVRKLALDLGAEVVVFDNELSPSQLNALNDAIGIRVTDRSGVILDIFADRAQSGEGRLQVELATMKYMLPRLTGHGIDMSRMGGQLRARGPGETKLETDRRHIRARINHLESELKEVRRVRQVQRSRREKNEIPVIALVGYTNAGKSTLMNALTEAGVQSNDRLFDTLDTTTRKFRVDDMLEALLSDTVGFIRKLPTMLVDAFRATLEELTYADLLLHVIDASAPDWRERARAVDDTLTHLGVMSKPTITVFNKTDIAGEGDYPVSGKSIAISAMTGMGLPELRAMIAVELSLMRKRIKLEIPYDQAALLDKLYQEATVHNIGYTESNIFADITCNRRLYDKLRANAEVKIDSDVQ